MVNTKYSMAVILVNDVLVSKKFYQDLFSLEIEHDFGVNISFKGAFSIWQRDRAEEIIFGSQRGEVNEINKNTELYFESSEMEAIYEKIKEKKIEIIHGIKEEPWGQKTLRFYDPEKFIIEVAEPIDEVVTRLSKQSLSDEEISKKTQLSLDLVKKILQKK